MCVIGGSPAVIINIICASSKNTHFFKIWRVQLQNQACYACTNDITTIFYGFNFEKNANEVQSILKQSLPQVKMVMSKGGGLDQGVWADPISPNILASFAARHLLHNLYIFSLLTGYVIMILEWFMLMTDTVIFLGIPLVYFLSDLYLSYKDFETF